MFHSGQKNNRKFQSFSRMEGHKRNLTHMICKSFTFFIWRQATGQHRRLALLALKSRPMFLRICLFKFTDNADELTEVVGT